MLKDEIKKSILKNNRSQSAVTFQIRDWVMRSWLHIEGKHKKSQSTILYQPNDKGWNWKKNQNKTNNNKKMRIKFDIKIKW
jgi:hypothetical protein